MNTLLILAVASLPLIGSPQAGAGPGVGAQGESKVAQGKSNAGSGLLALRRAAKAKKYAFVYFYKTKAQQNGPMKQTLDEAMPKLAGKAESISIDVRLGTEKGIVDQFKVARMPMPLLLAVAPNGAVTLAAPLEVDEKKIFGALVSPALEQTLKALQDGKYVVLCVQNAKTKANALALKGAREFKADKAFCKTTEIVILDPANKAEVGTLERLKIDPKTNESITVLMAPPHRAVARFTGATKKADFSNALSSCCEGGT